MTQQEQQIINGNTTKTAKIIALLELGWTRTGIAELETLGKYGAIQNVYAKWQTARLTQPSCFSFTPLGFNKKFGIEIEAYGIERNRVAEALRASGISCNAENYNHDTGNAWKVVTDGSLAGDNAFELVSSILEGNTGLEQVRIVSEVLTRLGAKINKTCGLHIHFDAAQMDLNNWKCLIKNYAALESTIDSMMPQSRRGDGNTYCRSMKIAGLASKIESARTLDDLRNIFTSRYHKINTQSFSRHRTIEFRQHSGTFEAEKIINWILFLHNLTDFSKAFSIETDNFEAVKKFNQVEVTNFYHNRIQDLAA